MTNSIPTWRPSSSISLGSHVSYLKQMDARTLLSCDSREIQLWDLVTRTLQKTISTSTAEARVDIRGAVRRGNELLAHTWDNRAAADTIQFWNLGSGECSKTLKYECDTHAPVEDMVLLDHNHLISARDTGISLWDIQQEKVTLQLEQEDAIVRSLAMTQDEKLLSASGQVGNDTYPGSVYLWDLETAKRTTICTAMATNKVVVHENTVFAGCTRQGVRVWDLRDKSTCTTLAAVTRGISDMLYFPRSHQVIAASFEDKNIQIWDIRQPNWAQQVLPTRHAPLTLATFQFDILAGFDRMTGDAKEMIVRYTTDPLPAKKSSCFLL